MPDAPTPPDGPPAPDPASWWAEPTPSDAAPSDPDGPPASDPAGTTAPARSSRRPLLWATAAAVALGMVGGGAYAATRDDGAAELTTDGTASSDEGGPVRSARGPGALGTIAAIDGATLTVEGDDGETTTVTTDDDTTVTDSAEGELADVAVGDTVTVMGEADADGVVTAERIAEGDDAIGPMAGPGGPPGAGPGGPGGGDQEVVRPEGAPDEMPEGMVPPDGAVVRGGPGGGTAGEVTAIDGDTLTVTTAEGDEVTVVATDDTTVTVTTEIGIADLAVGDSVAVMGTDDGDAIAADTIRRGELPMVRAEGPAGPPTTEG